MPAVIFLTVSNNSSKISAICETIHRQFLKGESILIAVQNDESAKYINELLWRIPEGSFLPHVIADRTSAERIAITKNKANVNKASVCFNLSPEPHVTGEGFKSIFELMDLTHPDKQKLSEEKLSTYRNQGYQVQLMEDAYVHSP